MVQTRGRDRSPFLTGNRAFERSRPHPASASAAAGRFVRHNRRLEQTANVNLTLEMPDELARRLEGIAATQHMSIQQFALERLRALVPANTEPRPGSAAAILRVMHESPHLMTADVDELDAAIRAGRLPVRTNDLF